MTRICNRCGFENQDDYDYCAKCGNPLIEGARPKQVYVYRREAPQVNKKAIILSYIVTIVLSWGGFIANFFLNNNSMSTVAFFGFFMPFYLVQSSNSTVKKHGFIQLAISLVGVALSFYVMTH